MSVQLPKKTAGPFGGKARYVMVGGFLGAGKTTLMSRLARHLQQLGYQTGLITNDQGSALADTALLRAQGFATEEIPGGCFCCRFSSLLEAAQRLTDSTRPDLFLAEPVGSCTDLVATVTYPLRRIYGDRFLIAPLTVLVDPVRARRMVGLETGPKFSDKVQYIYHKQLEEADIIAINKIDSLGAGAISELRSALAGEFPRAERMQLSSRTGAGFQEWFERIFSAEQSSAMAIDVDYSTYADGEALLGWLNATVQFAHPAGFLADSLLRHLAAQFQQLLPTAEIAHLKMTFSPESGFNEVAVINLVRNDFIPELSQSLEEPSTRGELIVNIRAEAAPDQLAAAFQSALGSLPAQFPKLHHSVTHLEYFRPGKPAPTHRLESP